MISMPEKHEIPKEPKLFKPDVRTVYFRVLNGMAPLQMEMDSGSPITIIPRSFYENNLKHLPISPTNYTFGSYSQSTVDLFGFITVMVCLESVSVSAIVYVAALEYKPLVGRNLMVACGISPSLQRMSVSSLSISCYEKRYPELFADTIGRIPSGQHRICLKPNAVPHAISQPRPIPLAKREAVCQALEKMKSDGIIEPVECSEWVHPLVSVFKKDGSVRICNDLQHLNKQIIVQRFVIPSIDELMVKLSGARIFTKLDLRNAFYHMPLTVESRKLTAFLTPLGLFQYKVLPMGLSSSPAAWQKFMVHTFSGFKGVIVYMDDMCIFGNTQQEHDAHLGAVLQRLAELNLRLNKKKCLFGVQELEFLGHVLSAEGIRPNHENSRAITETSAPKNVTELKHFLGLCSYYLRFLPQFATVVEPLRKLTTSKESFVWNDEQQAAFEEVKRQIASAPTMAIFNENCPTYVSTDASDVGLGAVPSQVQNGVEKCIAYASRKLSPREQQYSAGEKEALACVWACEKWNLYLYGRPFTLRTDHAALTTLLSRGNKGMKPLRISRWYARLLRYTFEMKYRPGCQNQIADGLSRLPVDEAASEKFYEDDELIAVIIAEMPRAITKKYLEESTLEDDLLTRVSEYVTQGWPKNNAVDNSIRPFYVLRHELSIVGSCVMCGHRIVVPERLIERVIQCAHDGHPGIVRTQLRVKQWFWWPRMHSSVEAVVRQCSVCIAADKTVKPVRASIQPVEYPMRPWSKLAIDIMGPFAVAPIHQKNVLVANCYCSRWPEVHLCGDVTTRTVIRWLKHLFARFGIPEEIVTDNGSQFTSSEFREFLERNGVRHMRSVPYNPQANGFVERFNRSLKESLLTIHHGGAHWEEAVVKALATFRTTPHRATGKCPAEIMFGRPIRTLLNAAISFPASTDSVLRNRKKKYQESYTKDAPSLKLGTYVRLRKRNVLKGQAVFTEPVKVIRICGPATYLLENGRKVNARQCFKCPVKCEFEPLGGSSSN